MILAIKHDQQPLLAELFSKVKDYTEKERFSIAQTIFEQDKHCDVIVVDKENNVAQCSNGAVDKDTLVVVKRQDGWYHAELFSRFEKKSKMNILKEIEKVNTFPELDIEVEFVEYSEFKCIFQTNTQHTIDYAHYDYGINLVISPHSFEILAVTK